MWVEKGLSPSFSVIVRSYLLLFAYFFAVKIQFANVIFFSKDERFPHTDFATGSSWSYEFTQLTNRKLLGLKLTTYIAIPFTIDSEPFMPSKFGRNVADVKLFDFQPISSVI